MPALADDSGLEVEELGWGPGLISSRVAPTDEERIRWLLERMQGKTRRVARFVACLAMVLPTATGSEVVMAEGICRGSIALEAAGRFGFGYDPVFIPCGERKTFAELGESVKSRISHRAVASRGLRDLLESPSMVESLSVRFCETD